MTTITNFFNNDYITFAAYDNTRKIPNICDGLKTSQRKVLYTILKKKKLLDEYFLRNVEKMMK